jgi:hypothetical protein
METVAIGRLALPVVIGLIGVAAMLMVVTMVFTTVRTINMVQRLLGRSSESGRSPVTIHIHTGRHSPLPVIQASPGVQAPPGVLAPLGVDAQVGVQPPLGVQAPPTMQAKD